MEEQGESQLENSQKLHNESYEASLASAPCL